MSSEVKEELDNGPKEEMFTVITPQESEDGSFLIGFIFPVFLPVLFIILFLFSETDLGEEHRLIDMFMFIDLGMFSILGLLCTLPLWPILGFGMASSIEFSQKTRNGAWFSAIIGLILGTILFFYLLSIAGKQY